MAASRRVFGADLAATALGALWLAAALAAQGGRFSPWLDLLAEGAPLWLVGALAVTVFGLLWAAQSRRSLIVILGVAGALAALVAILPEMTRSIRVTAERRADTQIKLIELNASHLDANTNAAADWLVGQAPDIILMEDVAPRMNTLLSKRGYNVTRGIANTEIFSRTIPINAPFIIPLRAWPLLPSFARATFETSHGPFSIVAVHLERPFHPDQMQGARALAAVLDHYDKKRLIVGGDFNLAPWTFGLRTLDHRLGLERRDRAMFTWPAAPVPILPLDHLYAGASWRTVRIERGPSLGSRHDPVIAILALER
jgi:endonuclease/exonuclease/phosphatase (EEP) superfamily protein YafD